MVPYPIKFNRTGWTFKEDYRPLLYFTLHNVSRMALRIPAFLRRVTESFSNGLRKMYHRLQYCISSPEQQNIDSCQKVITVKSIICFQLFNFAYWLRFNNKWCLIQSSSIAQGGLLKRTIGPFCISHCTM